MPIKQIKSLEEYDEAVARGKCVIDFCASWCRPCKLIEPFLKQKSETTPGVAFYKVDVDQISGVCEREGITCMPAIKLYKDGKHIETVLGASTSKLAVALCKLD